MRKCEHAVLFSLKMTKNTTQVSGNKARGHFPFSCTELTLFLISPKIKRRSVFLILVVSLIIKGYYSGGVILSRTFTSPYAVRLLRLLEFVLSESNAQLH